MSWKCPECGERAKNLATWTNETTGETTYEYVCMHGHKQTITPEPRSIIDAVRSRYEGQREWLKENHPETFEEQKHCDGGTPERAYWHHGYMMALGDILRKNPVFPDDPHSSLGRR